MASRWLVAQTRPPMLTRWCHGQSVTHQRSTLTVMDPISGRTWSSSSPNDPDRGRPAASRHGPASGSMRGATQR